jgi:hypothetical protein
MSSGKQLASLFTICLTIQERLLLAAPSRLSSNLNSMSSYECQADRRWHATGSKFTRLVTVSSCICSVCWDCKRKF